MKLSPTIFTTFVQKCSVHFLFPSINLFKTLTLGVGGCGKCLDLKSNPFFLSINNIICIHKLF